MLCLLVWTAVMMTVTCPARIVNSSLRNGKSIMSRISCILFLRQARDPSNRSSSTPPPPSPTVYHLGCLFTGVFAEALTGFGLPRILGLGFLLFQSCLYLLSCGWVFFFFFLFFFFCNFLHVLPFAFY